MADEDLTRALRRQIFQDSATHVYAVLDGASIPNLPRHLETHDPDYVCLLSGELHPEVAQTAPYLVRLTGESNLTDAFLTRGWGQHWGIVGVVPSYTTFFNVRRHFRGYLRVRGPDGKALFFRYYDPRVFRTYAPTCNPEEARVVFGPVSMFLVEGETPESLVRLSIRDSAIHEEQIDLTQGAQGEA